ncbi:hypothetical protein MUN84_14265 [Hymenobacter sp. 5516J-16]|uniref:hypothetical protein n=1 Tax=Hymenobacter sp. 5516J-16 TaxID=2932253 RepID=UPI001FD021A6|nr:hypothetical protein [Hymenobacter sp. 5516J-16]UOQ75805.1 hypothetical protein MUN84_14265 [Hymenobacter sp. 5516J-16]
MATVVNLTLVLGTQWRPGAEQSIELAIVVVGITAGLALNVTKQFRELAYPAAVAWGLLGIWAARRAEADTLVLAWMALAAAGLVVLGGLGLAWWGRRKG